MNELVLWIAIFWLVGCLVNSLLALWQMMIAAIPDKKSFGWWLAGQMIDWPTTAALMVGIAMIILPLLWVWVYLLWRHDRKMMQSNGMV